MNDRNDAHDACCERSRGKSAAAASAPCPACGARGRAVKPITIESLVTGEARSRAGRTDGFHFCAEPSCDVAYYHPESGARIARGEIRVRIGQKESEPPRPICYCFDHSVEEIEAEVAATGTSRIADDITDRCRRGLDRCEETNPQGSCCLGNVRRTIREARERRAGKGAAGGVWASAGAVVSAILSSACCWLPLLLIAFGASAAGVAGFFEAYRPLFLGVTAVLLAAGFYLVYFRKERCAPGEACASPNPRLRTFNKIMLWVASAVVLAFALFPSYVGYLLGNGSANSPAAALAPGEGRMLRIEGMTCAGCASALETRLSHLPGVRAASVDYESGRARVALAPEGSIETVLEAVSKQGYQGKVVQ